jgi:hypothetical protein
MAQDYELIRKLQGLSSRGFNPDADNFLDALGINQEDVALMTQLILKAIEEEDNFAKAWIRIYELSKYMTDDVARAFLFFHLGVIYSKKDIAVDETKEKLDAFQKGFEEGFAKGYEKGIEKGMEMTTLSAAKLIEQLIEVKKKEREEK